MPIQAFCFPVPETRFFKAGQHVYKFKIRRGEMSRTYEEVMLDGALVSEELETAVRAVLANLDDLHPFTTQHFNIFPYTSKWERVSKLRFMKEGVQLSTYPFVITLYVECRELVSHAVTNTSAWNLPENNSLCASGPVWKVQTDVVEHPEEGAINQDNHKIDQSPQKSPYLADGAEEMVCGSEIYADLQCDAAPETSDPNSVTKQNTGIITKLASSLFPFSMFFRKSSAE